jgi:hypothetical protein
MTNSTKTPLLKRVAAFAALAALLATAAAIARQDESLVLSASWQNFSHGAVIYYQFPPGEPQRVNLKLEEPFAEEGVDGLTVYTWARNFPDYEGWEPVLLWIDGVDIGRRTCVITHADQLSHDVANDGEARCELNTS